jgi:uncharacterized protein (TIGR00730 family)
MTARQLRRVAVFCGSNAGDDPAYAQAAAALGQAIATRGLGLVYGGTHKGLMGVLADAALQGGAQVHGVITRRLADRGHLHQGLSSHEILDDMKARKSRMLALADACIALPGGIGTVEEFMETWTLNQLGDIDRPAGLLNVLGFYDPLLDFLDGMVAHRFLPAAHRAALPVSDNADLLLDRLANAQPITVPKWIS